MDAHFGHLDRIISKYFRRIHGVETNKILGVGWQIARRNVDGSQAEWFWLHLRSEIPSGELLPYFCFQITSPDKGKIHDESWVYKIEQQIGRAHV